MTTKQRSKAGEFLIELVIIVLVFSVCCAIGVRVLSVADSESRYAVKLTDAKHIAGVIAEQYKAGMTLGEIEQLVNGEGGKLSYDTSEGALMAEITERDEGSVFYLDIKIYDDDYVYTNITCARISDRKG